MSVIHKISGSTYKILTDKKLDGYMNTIISINGDELIAEFKTGLPRNLDTLLSVLETNGYNKEAKAVIKKMQTISKPD